jgi:hypothetical protein
MKFEHGSRRVLAAAIVGGFSLSSAAQAITSTTFTYSTPKAGFYSIDPMALAPLTGLAADRHTITLTPASLTSTGGCYNTGVNLPTGAKVTNVAMWYSSGATSDVDIRLFRNRLSDGSSALLVDRVISDNSNTRKAVVAAVSASLAIIGNGAFSYGFIVCLASGDAFYGARINYTYQNAGD